MTETTIDLAAATKIGNKLTHKMNELTEAYHADADLRARAAADPRAVLVERGLDELAPSGAEVRIVANTGDTVHFMLPPDPNAEVSDETLANVAGGSTFAPVTVASSNYSPSCYIADGSTRGATSSGQ